MLALAAACAATLLINESKEPWTPGDMATQTQARLRCERLYGDEAPCLIKFIKKEPGVFWAICGEANNARSSGS